MSISGGSGDLSHVCGGDADGSMVEFEQKTWPLLRLTTTVSSARTARLSVSVLPCHTAPATAAKRLPARTGRPSCALWHVEQLADGTTLGVTSRPRTRADHQGRLKGLR